MKTVTNLQRLQDQPPCSLALGAFDGLHLGHQEVLGAAVKGLEEAAVFTFSGLASQDGQLLTFGDKEKLLESYGIHRLYRPEFSAVRHMEAESFVQNVLFEGCKARQLCCGEDFRFGRGAVGDVALLGRLCAQVGVTLTVVPPVKLEGEKISSTRIRKAVSTGNIRLANRLLGRPFGFTQTVVHGNHLGGPVLGAPTINQALPDNFVFPRFGVYASYVNIDETYYLGVTNVGVKPTVGSDRVLAETWMPGFSGDVYGKELHLSLLEFIRPEKKFHSLDELKEEIHKNAETARRAVEKYPPAFELH